MQRRRRHLTCVSCPRRQSQKLSGGGAALQDVPLVGRVDDSDVSESEISEEDLEFVQKHGRRLGFLEKLDQKALDQ